MENSQSMEVMGTRRRVARGRVRVGMDTVRDGRATRRDRRAMRSVATRMAVPARGWSVGRFVW